MRKFIIKKFELSACSEEDIENYLSSLISKRERAFYNIEFKTAGGWLVIIFDYYDKEHAGTGE